MYVESTAGQVAGPSDDLELVNYGAGAAWLRPELDAAIRDADQVHQDLTRLLERRDVQLECRYTITEAGRDYLAYEARERAMQALFDHPWPTVAEVCAEAEGAA